MHELNPLTVTQLNKQVRTWLEGEVGDLAVIGELSNLSKPSSGHFYFTLKDATAQIRCVFFRNYHIPDSNLLKDGQQVVAKGKLSLYEARGDYQLIVNALTEAGLGELYYRFEQLKAKLQKLGLFDLARKKPIPHFPVCIGIITSGSGAALQDILSCLNRRYPLARVRIYPSEVQGKEAHLQLIHSIHQANTEKQSDVIILARGGGSLEDLWAFNNEQLAFAIRQSNIPIVTGVGHETDFTIADFVADLRAATPTAAAEAVTPNQSDLLAFLHKQEERLINLLQRCLEHKQLLLSHQIAQLLSPAQLIMRHWQAIDYLERHLARNIRHCIWQKRNKLHLLINQLNARNPAHSIKQANTRLNYLQQQLIQIMFFKLSKIKQILTTRLITLHAVSPLATLERGYAIATYQNVILFDSSQVNPGDNIKIQLAKGQLICNVHIKE